jgi:hypothetical protein
MVRIMVCNHSLGRNDILKFVYCFIILFLIYLLAFFTNHQENAIILSF